MENMLKQRIIMGLLLGIIFLACPLVAETINPDPVLDWNARALKAIRTDKTSGPKASRNLAMVHAAIFDAVNAITGERQPVHVRKSVTGNVSPEAAVIAAAHRILVHIYPKQSADFDHALLECYGCLDGEEAKKAGIKLGREVADGIIAWRAKDLSSTKVPYSHVTGPGFWQPANSKDAVEVQWPRVACFCLADANQFRPSPPPELRSEYYTQLYYDVKRMGQKQTRARSVDQTSCALFWDIGTGTPPGYWNAVASQISQRNNLCLEQNAHLFALLNLALADTAIATWDCKYTYCFWRPVEAIHQADKDGNPATQVDIAWEPLLIAPQHPEYVSGHSAFSGAGATILSAYFGDDIPFSSNSEGEPGRERSFKNFQQAAEEAGRSRVYGGIHFQSANESGLRLGRQVSSFVITKALRLH